MPNVQKKLSGYQYKRRRLEKEAQTQKQVGALKKYLQSTCSSTEINDNTAECPILNPGIKENTESPKIDEQQMEVISKPSGSGTIPLPHKSSIKIDVNLTPTESALRCVSTDPALWRRILYNLYNIYIITNFLPMILVENLAQIIINEF